MLSEIKTRVFPEHNYKGIYHKGKTIRIALDPKKPISELRYPEFWDVKITNKCHGQCPWCYQDSMANGEHTERLIPKTFDFFGEMDQNQRPFQVAIGGGEPTLHPEFIKLLKAFVALGITPNYTTNGMHLSDEIVSATKEFCGGVAVSTHLHLTSDWWQAANKLVRNGIRTNFHIIISDWDSVNLFLTILDEWKDSIEYFVLLPYTAKGRAEYKEIDWEYLSKKLDGLKPELRSKIAFGANFYQNLKGKGKDWNISLYEPEIFSKYLDMTRMKIFNSSFAEGA